MIARVHHHHHRRRRIGMLHLDLIAIPHSQSDSLAALPLPTSPTSGCTPLHPKRPALPLLEHNLLPNRSVDLNNNNP